MCMNVDHTIQGNPCRVCNSTLRYKRNDGCISCINGRIKRFRESIWGCAKSLLNGAKHRNLAKGLLFTMTLEDILRKFEESKGYCAISGDAFNLTTDNNAYAPSLDQISPGEGYTNENTQLVCWWANAAKGDWFTHEESKAKFWKQPPSEENKLQFLPEMPWYTKSGFRGVEKIREGRYLVKFQTKPVGEYATVELAARVYDRLLFDKFGKFCQRRIFNFPNDPLIETIPESLPIDLENSGEWRRKNFPTEESIVNHIDPKRRTPNPLKGTHQKRVHGCRGVKWVRQKGKWQARITINKSRQHLGYFDTEIEAGKAYDQAVEVLRCQLKSLSS